MCSSTKVEQTHKEDESRQEEGEERQSVVISARLLQHGSCGRAACLLQVQMSKWWRRRTVLVVPPENMDSVLNTHTQENATQETTKCK